ncbi:MAG: lipoyl synthase [Prolixibacteraceae bacterium]|nr:lipoyl synthase [Prolixibacteraceae bacterium]NLX29937.1 lipoyl synthase [Bacteroidales bacterium]HNQ37963.1 lipoyl synthase [Prolixibacteraceae bacterium]HPJ77839.1 lipoyl synthase [Prolixibacteraceae bacterium]HRV88458.1 lipoyl synthase [Prolixibacteraceae bacterium]
MTASAENTRLPRWMKMKMPSGENYSRVKNLVAQHGLHTICTSGNCPNIGECWNRGTATFMILGEICTRSCKFCGVKGGKPLPPDPAEPARVAESVRLMGVRHCVITSVDRDDLEDQGAGIWALTITEVKRVNPDTRVEVLIPDFRGDTALIAKVLEAGPDVVSHNLETVERLTPRIRSVARYRRSLEVIRFIAASGCVPKSGIMLGLGETREEVLHTMDDLLEAGCRVLTIGQYLAPTKAHMPVAEYFPPEVFEDLRKEGLARGFRFVESSPLVRSSYRAEDHVQA